MAGLQLYWEDILTGIFTVADTLVSVAPLLCCTLQRFFSQMCAGYTTGQKCSTIVTGHCPCCLLAVCAVLQEVVSRLQSIGVGVVQYHPEAAPGQFEVALSPGKAHNLLAVSETLLQVDADSQSQLFSTLAHHMLLCTCHHDVLSQHTSCCFDLPSCCRSRASLTSTACYSSWIASHGS